jgi:hypothetical protein
MARQHAFEHDDFVAVGDPQEGDEQRQWTRQQLIRMDAKFSARMKREAKAPKKREERWQPSRKN